MKAYSSRLAVLENGASLKVISKSTVEDFEIPLPELEMQKHIANILDKLDSLCRKRTKATHLANELLAAVVNDKSVEIYHQVNTIKQKSLLAQAETERLSKSLVANFFQ
jgi:hypothetical protein